MIKAWLSAIGFILIGIFVPILICSAGCNIFSEFLAAASIAVPFHISLYYIITGVAESFKIKLNEEGKKKAHIYIGLISLLVFIIFMYGFHGMESTTVINLTK